MARAPNERAEIDYINGMKYKDIAEKYGVSINTVKSWKQRYKWLRDKKSVHTEIKKERTQKTDATSSASNNTETKKDNNKNEYMEVDELTERQRLFAEIYIRTFNATQSAIKAGYSINGAFVEGSRLLRNVKVKGYIDYLRELKKESILATIDDIVEKQMRIAFADMTDYIEFGREVVPIMYSGLPVTYTNPVTGKEEIAMQMVNTARLKESWEVDGSLVKEINVTKQGTSIKLQDQQKAMEWLANYFGENPMDKYKKEFDNKKLKLEKEKFEHQKEVDKYKCY